MKRLPLILNIVLAVAVVALYVLHFTGIGSPKKNSSFDGLPAGSANGSSIFYVQIDSVLSHFDMATDLSGELQSKFTASQTEFENKQKAYQNDVNDYQYKAQRGLITRSEAQAAEQELYGKTAESCKITAGSQPGSPGKTDRDEQAGDQCHYGIPEEKQLPA